MLDALPKHYILYLDSLCQLVSERKFKEVELEVLSLIEELLSHANKEDDSLMRDIVIAQIIYSDFNDYYLNWTTSRGKNAEKENTHLVSDEHSNYLIAHSTEVADMDDLLYELNNYLTDLSVKKQKEEVKYHLKCYKRYINA
ncbi:hypothetical protein A3F03_03930 [Candidatus Roizmanbacteria bacterium RIFCSPHIGHO2_12_FULL_41_11]|uniref:Uncharacterized protein n=1 Tax=Candidatus Roizmanbacteria bacterium RIFCSPHIGHO2_12_FULL_41_11 TaxID=1802052 RepID=A0A1F7I1B8_9BACT|nr:MAG: hypothetical protein A3F03_03930 [Candidatus Roizmanbacteria bacterium RIFCSPHIGHO2_12_FULL_41_11]